MSSSDSFERVQGGWESQSVRVDASPEDFWRADGADPGGFQEGLMDTLFDRSRGVTPIQAPFVSSGSAMQHGAKLDIDGPAIQTNLNLQAAWNTARNFQTQTTKLEAGKITAASGPGARNAGNFIDAKASATQDLQANIAAARKESGAEAAAPNAPAGGGGVGVAKNLAVSSVVGAVADMVIPGAGVAMTVAAAGAGTFGAKSSKSAFTSAAEQGAPSMYQPAAGHESVDIMQPARAPVVSGQDIDRKLSSGPGFGMGDIEHIVEPSLKDARPTFNQEQLAALQATASQMQRDVDMGAQMYNRWMESDVTVSDSIGTTPIAELKVKDGDMAALTRDNPALDDEAVKPPTMSAMKLA